VLGTLTPSPCLQRNPSICAAGFSGPLSRHRVVLGSSRLCGLRRNKGGAIAGLVGEVTALAATLGMERDFLRNKSIPVNACMERGTGDPRVAALEQHWVASRRSQPPSLDLLR